MPMPDVLSNLRKRPGLYLREPTYDAAVAYVSGYDAGSGGGLLVGFREWLIPRLDDGNNLAGMGLVRALLERGERPAGPGSEELTAIEFLLATLEAFLRERDRHDGLRRIHLAYEAWLRQQDWYTPSSPQWIDLG